MLCTHNTTEMTCEDM